MTHPEPPTHATHATATDASLASFPASVANAELRPTDEIPLHDAPAWAATPWRPEPLPLPPEDARLNVDRPSPTVERRIEAGEIFLLRGSWAGALDLHGWLKRTITGRLRPDSFESDRRCTAAIRGAARRLLVEIRPPRAMLERAPDIGWIPELYPETGPFALPLTDVLGLNGAWQWHVRGLPLPGIKHLLHPRYGVYFPTRTSHLIHLDRWLNRNTTTTAAAIDVGCGAGAITFYLLKNLPPSATVRATDINPAAVASLQADLERAGLAARATVGQTDLLGSEGMFDLIVFNPPWLPGMPPTPLDAAIYYPPGLFDRFFGQARERLNPGGRLIVLFSNFAKLARLPGRHPVDREVKHGGRFTCLRLWKAPVDDPSGERTPAWLHKLRRRERLELWELGLR